ncbi:MAG: hypothetical protein QGI10_14570 [Vicinamibacterales bacterium]|nr:hypothetical protein [Vicinamibacterales bacterium]MDP7480483.1 hypothetical protein [Vicinamibacterales bacterium]
MMVNRHPVGRSGPTPIWRVWLVALAVAVVGAAAVSVAGHAEHDADPNCVVCKLRHQPLAALSGNLQVSLVDASELVMCATVITWIPSQTDAQVPTRGPPLS